MAACQPGPDGSMPGPDCWVVGSLDAADAGAIPGPNPSTRDRSRSRSPHRRGGLGLAVASSPSSRSPHRRANPDPVPYFNGMVTVPCFYATVPWSSGLPGTECELIGKTQVRMTNAPIDGFVASPQYRICCHECTNCLLNTDSAVIAERYR